MKSLNQIYSVVLESLYLESIKDDAIEIFSRVDYSTPEEVQKYIKEARNKNEIERTDAKKEKTGVDMVVEISPVLVCVKSNLNIIRTLLKKVTKKGSIFVLPFNLDQ